MPIRKNLYSSKPWNIWYPLASHDYAAAVDGLFHEILCLKQMSHGNLSRLLFCAYQLKDLQLIEDILELYKGFKDLDPRVLAATLYCKLINENMGFEDIILFVNLKKQKLSKEDFDIFCTYLVITLFMFSNHFLYEVWNELLKIGQVDKVFNELCRYYNRNKIEFLNGIVAHLPAESDLSYLKDKLNFELIKSYSNDKSIESYLDHILKSYKSLEHIDTELCILIIGRNYRDALRIVNSLPIEKILSSDNLQISFFQLLKETGHIERGYNFIKDNAFHISNNLEVRYRCVDLVYSGLRQDLYRDKNIDYILASNFYSFSFRAPPIHSNSADASSDTSIFYIILSFENKFMCQRTRINGKILWVAETDTHWYTIFPGLVIEKIKFYLENQDKIVIIGASKSAFGAILLGELLSRHVSNKIYVIAFSPQVRVYPFCEDTALVSEAYKSYYRNLCKYDFWRKAGEEYGDLPKIISPFGAHIYIYVGAEHRIDRQFADTLALCPAVRIGVVPGYKGHQTLTYFYLPLEKAKKRLADAPGEQSEDFRVFSQIVPIKESYNYSLEDVIAAALNGETIKFDS